MRYQSFFNELTNCINQEQAFKYLMDTLNESIKAWDYFVNWGTVFGNIGQIEKDLNTMNYLVGKEDVEAEFKSLLRENPRLIKTVPILLATREKNFKILTSYAAGSLVYEQFTFAPKPVLTESELDKITRFAKETGLLGLFRDRKIKSLPDYVLGVEVGLGSNGRKNRGGTAMEGIVESLVKPICQENGLDFLNQVNAQKANEYWAIQLPVDRATRIYDFAVRNANTVYLIETNYYGVGGSKLKATAEEYRGLNDLLKINGFEFIWITDGEGWRTTRAKLEEVFYHNEHTLNINMVMKGILKRILVDKG